MEVADLEALGPGDLQTFLVQFSGELLPELGERCHTGQPRAFGWVDDEVDLQDPVRQFRARPAGGAGVRAVAEDRVLLGAAEIELCSRLWLG